VPSRGGMLGKRVDRKGVVAVRGKYETIRSRKGGILIGGRSKSIGPGHSRKSGKGGCGPCRRPGGGSRKCAVGTLRGEEKVGSSAEGKAGVI